MQASHELFYEIDQHLLMDDRPSLYLTELLEQGKLSQAPYHLLEKLRGTEQSPEHHPEGDVWNHTMLVVDQAAKVKDESKDPQIFMWAALLHDIGKPDTTKRRRGRITAYDHDIVGAKLATNFLKKLGREPEFIQRVTALVRWHMQVLFVIKNLPFASLQSMRREVDLEEIALLGYCDRTGRLGADLEREKEQIQVFLEKARAAE